jgi:hypothetical protein
MRLAVTTNGNEVALLSMLVMLLVTIALTADSNVVGNPAEL